MNFISLGIWKVGQCLLRKGRSAEARKYIRLGTLVLAGLSTLTRVYPRSVRMDPDGKSK